jgi:hypothetical protein
LTTSFIATYSIPTARDIRTRYKRGSNDTSIGSLLVDASSWIGCSLLLSLSAEDHNNDFCIRLLLSLLEVGMNN